MPRRYDVSSVGDMGQALADLALLYSDQRLLATPDKRRKYELRKMVSIFAAGHGFTSSIQSGAPTFTLNDTSDFVLGSQALKITCNANDAGYVSKTGMAAIDTTGYAVRLRVKIENLASIVSATLYLGDTAFTNFYFFNIFQSGGGTTFALDGEWVTITLNFAHATVTGSPARNNITDARIRLNAGPSSGAVLHVNELSFVKQDATNWTNGVVSLTFDDGWLTQYTQAKPKMDQYGFPGTAYPITELLDESTHTYMRSTELQALQRQSDWEIGVHAHSLERHNATFAGITAEVAIDEWVKSKRILAGLGLQGHSHMAWPLGIFDAVSMAAARQVFNTARTIYEKTQETLPAADPMRLRIRNVQNTTTTASLQTDIDNAYANGQWLILMFHRIETPANAATQYTPANFGTVIDYLNTKGIPVRTVGDVYSTIGG